MGIDLDQLEATLAKGKVKACLLSACFQNPLGYNLSPDDKQRIARMANHYQCPVIEDDVFGECGYSWPRPLPIKAWDTNGQVIWCSSFSKTLAAGYRIGWCAPGIYQASMRRGLLSSNLSVNTPLQLALADFIHCGEYRRHLGQLQIALAAQLDSLKKSVAQHLGGYAVQPILPVAIHCGFRCHKHATGLTSTLKRNNAGLILSLG